MDVTEDMLERLERLRALPAGDKAFDERHLYGLKTLKYYFGDAAVEAVKLGLSRPIKPCKLEAAKLVSDWESRDKACCFEGSSDLLLTLPATNVIAVSYKHVPREEWTRNGDQKVSKMAQTDIDLLCQCVELQKYHADYVILWCDQIIAMRLQGKQNTLGWYNAGLLPYMVMKVLFLSPHIPNEQLENRVWIRAERSLARMTVGFILSHEVTNGSAFGCAGKEVSCDKAALNLSKMILSGYWPPDLGYWAQDYLQMKRWAFGVVTRSTEFCTALFEDHGRVENVEILEHIPELAFIPEGLEKQEPIVKTKDKWFYLKATTWNPAVEDMWNTDERTVSHFMGSMGVGSRFSWWAKSDNSMLFGCLVTWVDAITVLAIKEDEHYFLYRSQDECGLYKHAERWAGKETQEMIWNAARKVGINIGNAKDFRYIYGSDDSIITAETQKGIQEIVDANDADADVCLSEAFTGMTTKLYLSMLAKEGQENTSLIARKVVDAVEEWNSHIKKKWTHWLSVRDTALGPVWLEGYNDEWVTFGFPEFLTHRLILDKPAWSENRVALCTVTELSSKLLEFSASGELGEDRYRVFHALYGELAPENSHEHLSKKDVARFMLQGGFTKQWTPLMFSSFLSRSGYYKGYWATMVQCRQRKLQIRFWDGIGAVRIAQRSTHLGDFTSKGLVHRDNSEAIRSISIDLDRREKRSNFLEFWKDMEDTCTFEDMWRSFQHVLLNDGRELLLVDMTTRDSAGCEGQIVHNPDHIAIARSANYHQLVEDFQNVGVQVAALGNITRDLEGVAEDRDQRQSDLFQQLHKTIQLMEERVKGTGLNSRHPELDHAIENFGQIADRAKSTFEEAHKRFGDINNESSRVWDRIEELEEKHELGLRWLFQQLHAKPSTEHDGERSSTEGNEG